jgi:outer membrane protein assembly factor BamB
MSAYAFDAATGAGKWSFDAKGEIESHGAYHNGTVYFSAEESRAIYALDAATGKQIWAWAGVAAQEINGSPTLTPTLLYAGSNDHKMHCLDRATGEERFSVDAQANVFASAAVADDGWVYFADNSATLDEINEQHAQMIEAFESCLGDRACAMSKAQAIWEAPTASEVEAGATPVGHVYAVNPSLHLH